MKIRKMLMFQRFGYIVHIDLADLLSGWEGAQGRNVSLKILNYTVFILSDYARMLEQFTQNALHCL